MPHRLNTFLSSSRELSQLTHKARQLMTLQQHFELVVPPSLQRGCRVMHLERQTLTVAADNGAIAAKLRQMTAELALQLQQRGVEVTVIQVQVQVSAPPITPPPKAPSLSQSGKNQLAKFADKLADSPLKTALNRLTRRN
ncbi:MAG: DciA family protein [Gallionellaceae bacterium]